MRSSRRSSDGGVDISATWRRDAWDYAVWQSFAAFVLCMLGRERQMAYHLGDGRRSYCQFLGGNGAGELYATGDTLRCSVAVRGAAHGGDRAGGIALCSR
jgi:hypothetical protein